MARVSAAPPQHVFNVRLVAGLVVAGFVGFVALVLLVAYGSRIMPIHGREASTLSVSATGYKGLTILAGRLRRTSNVRYPSELAAAGMLIVALEPQNRPQDVARLIELRRDKTTLIILPKWVTMPDLGHPGWVRLLGTGAGAAAGPLLGAKLTVRASPQDAPPDRYASGRDFLEGLAVPVPRHVQTIDGEGVTPLVTLPNGDALVARLGEQPHYIAADPDLFNNHGLKDPARAQAALALIDALNSEENGPIAFDLTVNGLAGDDSPSLLRTVLEPPFLAMTLALLFAAILAGLHGAFRFGQPRAEARAIAFGKAALVENSAGLIRLARREARLGGAYADVVRQEAARLAAAPPALQNEALDAYLDRLTKGDRPPFSALAARLASARDRHELVAAARALFSWKKDIIR
jgi:hypothetical protein